MGEAAETKAKSLAAEAKTAEAEAKDAEVQAEALETGPKPSAAEAKDLVEETKASEAEAKGLEEPEVVMVDEDPEPSEKEAMKAADLPVEGNSAVAAILPPPVADMQITTAGGDAAKMAARPETSSCPMLELVDYNFDIARLREATEELEKKSTLLNQQAGMKVL